MKNCLLTLLILILPSLAVWGSDDDKAYFMVTQNATTASVMSARQKALTFARNTLATMIDGKIKNVAESYLHNNTQKNELADEFITETKTTAHTLLQNVSVADETVVKEKKGMYTVYITLKINKNEFLDTLCKRLSENKATKGAFNKETFTNVWKKENK